MQADLYAILGVDRKVNDDDLKKAYRKQALRYHPDRNEGDKEAERRFKEATYAYQVLSDPSRRLQYDRFGRVFSDGRSQGPFGAAEDIDLGEVVGKLFRDLFGRKRPSERAPSARDLRYAVTVSIEEVATGTEKELRFRRRGPDGEQVEEQLKVRVPAGVDTGQKLKVSGKGSAGQGGSADLFVVVNVARHSFFKRRGRDLFCDVPVSYAQAVLGAEIEVPTPRGISVIRLPERSQPGAVLTLKGHGLPSVGRVKGKPGDLYVKLVLDMPGPLDDAIKSRLGELEEELVKSPSKVRTTYEELLKTKETPQPEEAAS